MRIPSRVSLPIASLAACLLAACGGGDDEREPSQVAYGTITSFGSVVVNGVRFDDSGAAVILDDENGQRSQLRVGMVVRVEGRIRADGTGVARTIRHADCVQGPITAMNRVQNTVTVMGQTVAIDDDTEFDGVTLRDMNAFSVGDHVEVSCLPDGAGQTVRATRMERLGQFQNGISALELKGVVANLDLTARTLTINGLTVDFSAVAAGSLPGGLANGMTVEASGNQYAEGTLLVQRLRDRDRDRVSQPDGDGLWLEGHVSNFVSAADFRIGTQAVNASAAEFRNGTAADLRDGVRVAVEGTLSGGVLMASRVVLRQISQVRVEAGLQSKDGSAGTLTLLGQPIQVTAQTLLRDRLASDDQPTTVTLADLATADRLRVQAYRDTEGALVATRVERTRADALVVVKGPADAKTPTTQLTLAGFAVDTGPASRYRDASGTLTDAASFYASVAVPPAVATLVHARGVVASLSATRIDATRATSTTGELEIAGQSEAAGR